MTPDPTTSRRTVTTALALATLATVVVGAYQVLQPFVIAGLWAVVLVVSSWSTLLWLQAHLGGRRWAAVLVLTLGLLLLLVIPLTLAISAAVVNAGEIAERAKALTTLSLPAPPAWLADLPFVGSRALQLWEQVAAAGIEGLFTRLAPYAGAVTRRFLQEASGLGFVMVEILLALTFAAMLYSRGEDAARLAHRVGRRLAGGLGSDAVTLATQAIRGVALGVGGTAIVQSVLTGIGLAIAGVPFVALLTAATFALCIAQLGTPFVLGPAVIWVYWSGETGWGTFLLVWSLIIGTADNVIRPLLIQRGVDLPFWLVFTGVVGGLLAFGLVGLFIGPVVLAVASMLLDRWLGVPETAVPAAAPAAPSPEPETKD